MTLSFVAGEAVRITRALRACLGAIALVVSASLFQPGSAQSDQGGLNLDQIKQILQGHMASSSGSGLGTGGDQSNGNQEVILQPSAPPETELPTSRLEQLMSMRAGVKLKQYGYDQFGIGRSVSIPQMGAVQDDYILGPGDEIDVSLRGQENAEYQTTVGRDGRVILPLLNPVSAAGRSFGEFRTDLVGAIGRAYVSTKAFVSISRLRQITVLVTGEVANPGARILTGLSTAADAIVISGGVRKTGSLRAIRIIRGGRSIAVDLYNLITQRGVERTVHLADGDRIIVPPLGRTVAVAGWVRLPGIYELAPGAAATSVRSLSNLAGGVEIKGKYRLSVLRQQPDGQSSLTKADERGPVKDGEILYVQPAADQVTSQAELAGGTTLAGRYPITDGMQLSELIKQPGAIGNAPDTTFGIVSRRDATSYIRSLIPFTPAAVLKGTEDMPLQTGDVVRVFSTAEGRMLRDSIRKYRQFRVLARNAARDPQGLLTTQPTNAETLPTDVEFLDQLGMTQTAASTNPPLGSATNAGTLQFPPSLSSMSVAGITYPNGGPGNPNAATNQNQPNPAGTGPAYPGAGASNGTTPYQNTSSTYPNSTNATGNPGGTNPANPNMLSPQAAYAARAGAGAALSLPPFPGAPYGSPTPSGEPSPDFPQGVLSGTPPANLVEQSLSGTQVPTNEEAISIVQVAKQLSVDPIILANFLLDRVVILSGSVRGPGLYLAGPTLTLDTLVAAAGGTSSWADKSNIDVTSTGFNAQTGGAVTTRGTVEYAQMANYIVKPRDEFHVHEAFADADFGSVTLQGEIKSAGDYQITRGEHLSQLLAQAGGLTDIAYPLGTVFLRRSAANIEALGYQRAADEIQSQLIGAMTRVTTSTTNRLSPNDFGALQTFVVQLRAQKPLGRITVVADPGLLYAKPQLDPLLEPGDVIYIPQRPSTVTVLGQVLQPGSFPFQTRASAGDYLQAAGGYAQFADESMTFVVLPDGKAEKVAASWFGAGDQVIPPGSTIVVPRDLAPYDSRQLLLDTTQILSQLAISAASLAVLSKQ